MDSSLALSWKIVITIPGGGPNYHGANKLFNLRTGKTFLRNIGGISKFSFFPFTLEPTNVFYDALAKLKIENNFTGKKLPFAFKSEYANSLGTVNVKIHLYGPNVVILSVSLSTIDIDADDIDFMSLQRIDTHIRLYNLVTAICGLIVSGDHRVSTFEKKLKTFPSTLLSATGDNQSVSDQYAVEILTRHSNLKPEIVADVLSKNKEHQLDDRKSILIDRQGIFARMQNTSAESAKDDRKYQSSHCLLELAVATSKILNTEKFHELSEIERSSLNDLIVNPDIVFANSVTARKTWELLLREFQLDVIYEKCAPSPNDDLDLSDAENSSWSDRKKWTMGIVGTLFVAFVIGIINKFWPFLEKLIPNF